MSGDEWTHRVVGGPWKERIGRRCCIVPPLRPGYPWSGKRSSEVVILIDGDPLNGPGTKFAGFLFGDWTCVLDAAHIEPLSGAGE